MSKKPGWSKIAIKVSDRKIRIRMVLKRIDGLKFPARKNFF